MKTSQEPTCSGCEGTGVAGAGDPETGRTCERCGGRGWHDGVEAGANDPPPRLTLFRCGGYEERQEAICIAQEAEERAEEALALDAPDRLAGDCDRCQEPQSTGLTMSGGDAVCDVCIRAELAEDEDVMF